MPSKNNKKKAAAERSAQLRANAEAADPVVEGNETPVADATTTTPTAEPVAPVAEMKSLSVTNEKSSLDAPSSETGIKKLPPYKVPGPLIRLTQGNTISVITNSFEMDVKSNVNNRLDVTVTKYYGAQQRRQLVGARGSDRQQQNSLFEVVMDVLERHQPAVSKLVYDGAMSCYLSGNVTFPTNTFYVESNALRNNLKDSLFPGDERGSLTITVERNTTQPTVNTRDVLQENLNGTSCPATQMLQIALQQEGKRQGGFTGIDGSVEMYEQPAAGIRLKNGIIQLKGIAAGIKIAEGQKGNGAAHIVLEYKNKLFFEDATLDKLGLDFNNRGAAIQFLKGLRVRSIYSNQSFIFRTLSDTPIGRMTFDGNSVLETAAKRARRPLSDYTPEWPAVQDRVRDFKTREWKTYSFPVENLKLAPNQKLNPKQGKPPQCILPNDRYKSMIEAAEKARILTRNPTLNSFGVSINPKPIVVNATRIPPPTILYKNGATQPDINKQTKWQIPRNAQFAEPAEIPYLLVLYNTDFLSPTNRSVITERAKDALNGLSSTASKLGVKIIGKSRIENLADTFPHANTAEEAIKYKMESLKNIQSDKKPAVIYIDNSSQASHGVLKLQERLCEVVTQQLSIDKSLKNAPGASTLTNIMLKLNKKFGGVNHKVAPDEMIKHLYGATSKTLIISYDVCHSSGRVYRKDELCEEPSCVGFAYNTTKFPDVFIGDFAYQLTRTEEVNGSILKEKTEKILQEYGNTYKDLPTNIVILRDGVSEGQHQMVYDKEYAAIRSGVEDFVKKIRANIRLKTFKDPAMALFIITKRHANRLYLKNGGSIDNVPPLIAIDKVVVKKAGNELIFVSHCPLKGSAQFIVVNMIVNEKVFTKNDELVRFLAALCCAHQVSTNIVSLPDSVYAADEYAKRGANLFQSWKSHLAETNGVIPTIMTNEEGLQNDWKEITEKLCYEKSVFKSIRIV